MKNWLRYYRACLANADQQKRTVETPPFSAPTFFVAQFPAGVVQPLWDEAHQHNKSGDDPIPIEIAPVAYYPSYEHAKPNTEQEEIIYPYWIPALLAKDGKLQPISKKDSENELPIFVQEYLIPDAVVKIAEAS